MYAWICTWWSVDILTSQRSPRLPIHPSTTIGSLTFNTPPRRDVGNINVASKGDFKTYTYRVQWINWIRIKYVRTDISLGGSVTYDTWTKQNYEQHKRIGAPRFDVRTLLLRRCRTQDIWSLSLKAKTCMHVKVLHEFKIWYTWAASPNSPGCKQREQLTTATIEYPSN